MPRDGERDRSKGGRAHTHSREERRAAVRRVSIDNWSAPLHCVCLSLSMVTLSIGYLFKRESVPGRGDQIYMKRETRTHTHKKDIYNPTPRSSHISFIFIHVYIFYILLCVCRNHWAAAATASIAHQQHGFDNMQCVSVGIVSNWGPPLHIPFKQQLISYIFLYDDY